MAKNVNKFKFHRKMFNVIPPGFVLVKKNIFTGTVSYVNLEGKKGPLRAVSVAGPFTEVKYVSALSETIDYKEFGYLTKDRVGVMVDIALEVKIVDPVKYEFVSSSVSNQLKVIIDDAVRKIFNNTDVATILSHRFDLYALIKPVLDSFKKQYGVEISKVSLQNIKLPEGVRKSYEQRLTTKADAERIREIADADAYASRVKNQVELEKTKKTFNLEVEKAKKIKSEETKQFKEKQEIETEHLKKRKEDDREQDIKRLKQVQDTLKSIKESSPEEMAQFIEFYKAFAMGSHDGNQVLVNSMGTNNLPVSNNQTVNSGSAVKGENVDYTNTSEPKKK